MNDINLSGNPFALMIDPEAVFAAIERSERLGRLKSRICRPLDGPRAVQPSAANDLSDFDAEVEAAVDAAPIDTAFEVSDIMTDSLDWPSIHYE